MPGPILVSFIGGEEGEWRVTEVRPVKGEPLPATASLAVVESSPKDPPPATSQGEGWVLRGVLSNLRYTTREEVEALAQSGNPPLARPAATRAAMIPMSKSEGWWAMTQEERTAVIAQGRHIAVGREYLPAVARRLHHGRDLGEPFDFVTWFEYAPEEEARFDELLKRLRDTPEWAFVTHEVDVRLERRGGQH